MLLSLLSMMQARSARHRVKNSGTQVKRRGTSTSSTSTRSSSDDRSDSHYSQSLLASVVQLLVDSGHLLVPEVGNLAQVSRELHHVTRDDLIWASLCRRHWIGTRHIPRHSLLENGHFRLYKQWLSPMVKRRPPSRLSRFCTQYSVYNLIPKQRQRPTRFPPTCTPDQLQLHVLVKYKGISVVSECITGEGMERFCTNGGIGLRFHRPFIFGKAVWESSEEDMEQYLNGNTARGLDIGCLEFDRDQFEVIIHYFRTTDSTMLCLLHQKATDCPQEYFPVRLHPDYIDYHEEQERGLLEIGPYRADDLKGLPLRKTREAAEILHRFPEPIDLACYVIFKMVRRGHFAMTEMYLDAMKKSKNGVITVERFKSLQEEKEHGVTLLHILSELQGT